MHIKFKKYTIVKSEIVELVLIFERNQSYMTRFEQHCNYAKRHIYARERERERERERQTEILP